MRLKVVPEDFFVREIISLDLKDSGKYVYFILKKKDFTTLEAVDRVAKWLRIPVRSIGYAGLKDRRAVTEQYCSAPVSKSKLDSIALNDIDIEYVGRGDSPIYRGRNEGNFFRIVVRDVDRVPEKKIRFINLFGEQRFSKQNVDVGRAIIKREFKKACELLECVSLSTVSKKLLRIYIHAYQSFLWNMAAELWAKRTSDTMKLPIVGFGTEDLDDITESVLDKEGIKPRAFVVRELPDLSAEGGERELYADVKDLKIEKKGNDVVLEFSLPSGSYATVFVRQLFMLV